MTRRSNVVRSEATAGEARHRDFGGGCIIYCAEAQGSNPTLALAADGGTDITEISLWVPVPYQRIYASATISSINVRNGDGDADLADINLVASNATSGYENTFAYSSGGGLFYSVGPSATITGVTDLPAGNNRIILRMATATIDGVASFDGAGLQVILGQLVDTPGCNGGGGSE